MAGGLFHSFRQPDIAPVQISKEHVVLVTMLGLVLTVVLVAKVWVMAGQHAADMGSVSHQWVAAHNASQPASSQ